MSKLPKATVTWRSPDGPRKPLVVLLPREGDPANQTS